MKCRKVCKICYFGKLNNEKCFKEYTYMDRYIGINRIIEFYGEVCIELYECGDIYGLLIWFIW